jgi:hypothetical protein
MKPRSLMTSAAIALMAPAGCVTDSSPGFQAGESLRMEEGVAKGQIMSLTRLRGAILVAVTLAIALIGMSAAFAENRPTLDCTIRFQLSGWSAIYERVDGTGIVACSDGMSLPVVVQARGAGLTVGKPKVTNGTGKFASVHHISDVLGTYAQDDMPAGLVKSGQAQLLTNGEVSLGLASRGQGYDLGNGIAGFTIRPQ